MTLALILETTLRTVLVAGIAGLGLAIFRVRSSTVKLTVWRLVLYASLLMPVASLMPQRALVPAPPAPVVRVFRTATTRLAVLPVSKPTSVPVDWQSVALRGYALATGLLLLRALLGLVKLRQLGMDAVAIPDLGPEVYETSRLTVPVTYGIVNPRILLPKDWRYWSDETLGAVLAHERAHIDERDFLTQCLSKVNRAIYWVNPLVWWLDRQLALLAEHASDDAAVSRVGERPAYAAVLLDFAERRSNLAAAGVAMARPGGVSSRIERILDEGCFLSRPLSRGTRVALATAVFAFVIAIGACKMSTVSAQTMVPPIVSVSTVVAQQSHTSVHLSGNHDRTQWVLVTPHGTSMNGDSDVLNRARSMRPDMRGQDYLIFIRDGKTFLVDDPNTIAQIEDWFKPMEELGRQQGELGEKQGVLGEQMGKLGEEMGKLGEQMSNVKVHMPDMKKIQREVEEIHKLQGQLGTGSSKEISMDELSNLQSRLGELQSLIGEAQSLAGGKQSEIGGLQSKLGEQQSALGEKQAKLGEQQARLGEQQAKIAEEAEKKLRHLFDQALQDGRAKPVK